MQKSLTLELQNSRPDQQRLEEVQGRGERQAAPPYRLRHAVPRLQRRRGRGRPQSDQQVQTPHVAAHQVGGGPGEGHGRQGRAEQVRPRLGGHEQASALWRHQVQGLPDREDGARALQEAPSRALLGSGVQRRRARQYRRGADLVWEAAETHERVLENVNT